MKNNKINIGTISFGIVFVIVLGIVGYFFIFKDSSLALDINKSVKMDTGEEIKFKAKADYLRIDVQDVLNDQLVMASDKKNLIVEIDAPKEVKCTYDIIYYHDEKFSSYQKSANANKELTITIDDKEVQIANFGKATNIGTFALEGKQKKETKEVEMRFYKLDVDQTAHANTIYKGRLDIQNIKCN